MMGKWLAAACLLLFSLRSLAQDGSLPVKEWPSPGNAPFVLYVSGDGGFNSFSTNLCTALAKAGYPVTALNARSYFWSKKTPEKAALDLGNYLTGQLAARKNQQLILVGFSFGADVLPFIINRFPASIQKALISVTLLAPSTSTDFEVHLSDMLGTGGRRSGDVVAEINKLAVPKVTTLFGSDDHSFPFGDLTLRNYHNEVLSGGHHFEGDADNVVKTMLRYF